MGTQTERLTTAGLPEQLRILVTASRNWLREMDYALSIGKEVSIRKFHVPACLDKEE